VRTVIPKEGTAGPALEDLEAANQVLQRAVAIVEEILEAVRAQAPFSISYAGEAVEMLLQSLEVSDSLLLPFFSAGSQSPSPAREAVNVCILSVKIGSALKYHQEALRDLGLPALLCDIGMARVPPEILGKQGPLTPEERALLKAHQREGAQLLQELEPEHPWLAEVVKRRYAKIAGPPNPEDRVEEFAAIIRLADMYESFVHHRPFRQRVGPLEALREILRRERPTFPDRILKALIQTLSTFPVGSLVRLNTGEIGRVVAKNKNVPLRPVVEVMVRRGKWLEEPLVIDLSQSPLHHIQDSVAEEALP
jgi:HD-GYP domain-containing protein (c-di-GMP phosphodiesterase class II)